MTITFPLSTLLEAVFPHIEDYRHISQEELRQIKRLYSFGPHQPEVELTEDGVAITFDGELLKRKSGDFQELIRLSENRAYEEALHLAGELIARSPEVSDYRRIKGQILSEQGQPDEAIDALIEAVRLDPDNHEALIMLGNIYAKDRSDADTVRTRSIALRRSPAKVFQ